MQKQRGKAILGTTPFAVDIGAKRGRPEDLRDIPAQVPDVATLPGDEL
ncbi:MAG: hypothetical protein L0Z50_25830 [Verrucomicrobiales bacterium]|nr:hypothetical protein [Verrucomicrobiales bacterium]